MAQGKSHSITRRSLLAGAATSAATALAGSPALPATPPDLVLATLDREFAAALVTFEAAHHRYSACERRYFALRRSKPSKAARARIRRNATCRQPNGRPTRPFRRCTY
jgi:hypothetical protein